MDYLLQEEIHHQQHIITIHNNIMEHLGLLLANVNTSRKSLNASSTGPTSSAVVFGGTSNPPTYLTATEIWNGTSWTTNPNGLATARGSGGGVGTQAAALMFGGYEPVKSNTEEFTGPGAPVTQTITTS
jgi:hypothetical protein